MNKISKIIVGLGSVACLVLLGTGVFAQGYSQEFQTAPVAGVYVTTPFEYEASWMIGHRVLTPTEDAYLGQISGLVVDQTNGRVAAVVLSDLPTSGGAWLGNEHLVLPYSSINADIGQSKVVFNPGDMKVGPSLEPNYTVGNDPWIYALLIAGHPEIFSIPATMDAAWLGTIYRDYGQVPYWEVAGQSEPHLVFIDSNRLMGARVQLSNGETVGEINDLVIDAPDGRIAFVVLSDVPDRPDTYVAVPFAALSTQGNVYVLNVTRDQLVSAMEFNEADLTNPMYATRVYSYFGIAPYWTRSAAAPTYREEGGSVNFNIEINK